MSVKNLKFRITGLEVNRQDGALAVETEKIFDSGQPFIVNAIIVALNHTNELNRKHLGYCQFVLDTEPLRQ